MATRSGAQGASGRRASILPTSGRFYTQFRRVLRARPGVYAIKTAKPRPCSTTYDVGVLGTRASLALDFTYSILAHRRDRYGRAPTADPSDIERLAAPFTKVRVFAL